MLDPLEPDYGDVPVDDRAEPDDADVDHRGPGGRRDLEREADQ